MSEYNAEWLKARLWPSEGVTYQYLDAANAQLLLDEIARLNEMLLTPMSYLEFVELKDKFEDKSQRLAAAIAEEPFSINDYRVMFNDTGATYTYLDFDYRAIKSVRVPYVAMEMDEAEMQQYMAEKVAERQQEIRRRADAEKDADQERRRQLYAQLKSEFEGEQNA